jgi:ferrous iron transport protein A
MIIINQWQWHGEPLYAQLRMIFDLADTRPMGDAAARPLSALPRGTRAVIERLHDDGFSLGDAGNSSVAHRLLELGFVPGAEVEVVETMWPGADPLAVRVRGSTFALRRREAALVLVRPASEP